MSAKNSLQEYCQKNKLSMPLYVSKTTGPSHKLEWYAKVEIPSLDICCRTTESSVSKIGSELIAAAMALELIAEKDSGKKKPKEIVSKPKSPHLINFHFDSSDDVLGDTNPDVCPINLSDGYETIVLVDLENKPMFKSKCRPDVLFIGFHNTIHHSVPKYLTWHICQYSDICMEMASSESNKLLYLIEGGVTDLVDHYMTMFTYPLGTYVKKNPKVKRICILTGDHAGFCTKGCLEKVFEWMGIKDIQIKNIGSVAAIDLLC